jgi:hypothetical protein
MNATSPRNDAREAGEEDWKPGFRSATRSVPAEVPFVFQGSTLEKEPLWGPPPPKTASPPMRAKVPWTRSSASIASVPAGVPSVLQRLPLELTKRPKTSAPSRSMAVETNDEPGPGFRSRTDVVAGVPVVFQNSSPMSGRRALKNIRSPRFDTILGYECDSVRSVTWTVPAGVPSVRHSSSPLAGW